MSKNYPINVRDIRYTARLLELGVPITSEDLKQSFLRVDLPSQKTFDLLIAPDAKEYEAEGTNRSRKSLPPEIWEKVAQTLPRAMRGSIKP